LKSGRVARAGRSGTAYSIIAPDEVAFLLDLHLFLNKPLKFTKQGQEVAKSEESIPVGRVPQDFLSEENSVVANLMTIKAELVSKKVHVIKWQLVDFNLAFTNDY